MKMKHSEQKTNESELHLFRLIVYEREMLDFNKARHVEDIVLLKFTIEIFLELYMQNYNIIFLYNTNFTHT